MRIAVVGAGIMGLSAAWAHRRDGHEVQVFDQAEVPNLRGSSVDQHRLIRFPYGGSDGFVRLVGDAYPAWERLWADLGEAHYVETGTLVFGDYACSSEPALVRAGVAHRWLDAGTVEQRFPLLVPERALWLATGGVLLAERIVAALAARLRPERARVVGLDPARARLRLEDGRVIAADRLVVAAGPWLPRLIAGWAGRVIPSRQVVVYLDPAELWARMPMVLEIAPDHGFYAVPPRAGTGLKIADHRFSLAGDPDQDREPRPEDVTQILDGCRPRLCGLARYRVAGAKTCFYTVDPSERLLIEPVERALVMSPCSGHGFKFGAVLGEAVADLVAGRREPAEVAAWAAGALSSAA